MALRNASVVAALLVLAACAGSSDPSRGVRALDAVVVGREHEPPGSGGASFQGTGNYYLVFEASEGEATSRYRFLVTERQYHRFTEGSRVKIVIADHILREIRPAP